MIEQLATRYGTMFVPDTDAGQYWWLANTGASPEDDCIELICNLLDERPKATAVDVGANFGCWTLPLSRHAHSVLAIEPQAGCVQLLKRSLAANNIRNVRLYMAAAGSLPGTCFVQELDFDLSTNFGGVSLLQDCVGQPDAQHAAVPVVRLDDLLRGEVVSFIKIDVEGYERKVLRGAHDTIMRCKPILFIEMDHPLTDADALKHDIEMCGYVTERMMGNYLCMPI